MSRSEDLQRDLFYEASRILKETGGSLHIKQIEEKLLERMKFDAWALENYESVQQPRWKWLLKFGTIAAVKAGFIVKKSGMWYLTAEGDTALLAGKEALWKKSGDAYAAWAAVNKKEQVSTPTDTEQDPPVLSEIALEDIRSKARESIEFFLRSKNPYEFQDLVAALLRAMGYHTPFVAPKGKDGGIDIIAYQDPLGLTSPRMKVQVKHRKDQNTGAPEIQQLRGTLTSEDVGIFVSSGGFSAQAKEQARSSPMHIELIDLDRFIELWQEFYPKMSEQDRALFPLVPVFTLAPDVD
jgi:restriction system protein